MRGAVRAPTGQGWGIRAGPASPAPRAPSQRPGGRPGAARAWQAPTLATRGAFQLGLRGRNPDAAENLSPLEEQSPRGPRTPLQASPHPRTCVRPPTGVRGPLSRRQRPVRALPAPQPATPPPLRRENSGFSSRSAVAVALGCLVEQVAHVACRDLAHVDPGHCEAVVLSRSRTVAVVATSGVGRRLLTCDRTPRSARMDRDG